MLSQKTKYALKALLYLAQQEEGHIAKTIEIAEGANIPKKFLEQIPQKNPRLNSSLLIRSNNFS